MSNRYNQGFTLIEVLIAAVILFATIATTTLVYSAAAQSSIKAEQNIALSGHLPFIVQEIEQQLHASNTARHTRLQGQGQVMQITYIWQARKIKSAAAMPRYEGLNSELVEQPQRYHLWQIEINARYRDTERNFSYEELTYQEVP